jgi:succinoglycan biosynthesis protein ExoO
LNPLVSVIIPAYNTEAYIGSAISSVLAQTLSDLEVVVVDDCSSDDTVAVVQSFTDERIKLLQNHQNLGAGGARNRALAVARGKWIAILDSDDWYAPSRLERLVAQAEAHDADLLSDDLYLINDGYSLPWGTLLQQSGEQISGVMPISPGYFVNSDIEGRQGLRLGFSKPLLKREFLERHRLKYNPHIKVAEDFWLYMDCFRYGARFFFVPQPYYYYRSRLGSLVSSDKIQRLKNECQEIASFFRHEEFLRANPQVATALLTRQKNARNYLEYYKVVEPLKQGKVAIALRQLLCNLPRFLIFFIGQIPSIVARRQKSWFKTEQLVINNMYEYPLPQKKLTSGKDLYSLRK